MQNLSYLKFKLQQQSQDQYSDNPCSTSRKFKVKELLRRYRNETSPPSTEDEQLKIKLLTTYNKLQEQISESQRLKEIINEQTMQNQKITRQNQEIKNILQKVIENRKHLDKELEESLKVNEILRSQGTERKFKEQELLNQNKMLKQNLQALKQIIENNSKQIRSLQMIVKERNSIGVSMDQEVKRLGLQKQKQNTIRYSVSTKKISHPQIQQPHINNQNQQPNIINNTNTDESKLKLRQRQFKVGKWKKNVPQNEQSQKIQLLHHKQNTNVNVNININPPEQKYSDNFHLNDDQLLTLQQTKKRALDQELAKLSRIKKPGIQQTQRIQQIQIQLYKTDSNISRLKRKIRSKY